MRKPIALALVGTLLAFGFAHGAQQGVPTKKLRVGAPPHGIADRAKVRLKVNAPGATIVGDPTTNGASLNLELTPGGQECFVLPSSLWEQKPSGLLKYDFFDPGNRRKVKVRLKVTGSGIFKLNFGAKGTSIEPGDPTLSYAANFSILGGGDEYCTSTGTASPRRNDSKLYLVVNDDGTACPLAACSPSGAFLEPLPEMF